MYPVFVRLAAKGGWAVGRLLGSERLGVPGLLRFFQVVLLSSLSLKPLQSFAMVPSSDGSDLEIGKIVPVC